MDVHYDYAAIAGVVGELTHANSVATALNETGQAHRTALAGTWQGTSQASFDVAYNAYHQANQNIIDVTSRAIKNLDTGSHEMSTTEQALAQSFPHGAMA